MFHNLKQNLIKKAFTNKRESVIQFKYNKYKLFM